MIEQTPEPITKRWGMPRKDEVSYGSTRQEIRDFWFSKERKLKTLEESEEFGKKWLLKHGFQYVWWFGEHKNNRSKVITNHPYDYYAEKNGEPWLIDATVAYQKNQNRGLLEAYLRMVRIGILFIYPDESNAILKEVNEVTSTIYLNKRDLGLVVNVTNSFSDRIHLEQKLKNECKNHRNISKIDKSQPHYARQYIYPEGKMTAKEQKYIDLLQKIEARRAKTAQSKLRSYRQARKKCPLTVTMNKGARAMNALFRIADKDPPIFNPAL